MLLDIDGNQPVWAQSARYLKAGLLRSCSFYEEAVSGRFCACCDNRHKCVLVDLLDDRKFFFFIFRAGMIPAISLESTTTMSNSACHSDERSDTFERPEGQKSIWQ